MNIPFLSLKDITAKYADEIHEAALRVIDGGWYLQGEENARFEADYAKYIGTKYCIITKDEISEIVRLVNEFK